MLKTKVVILGDSGVGKSSILHRLKFDNFHQKMESTIGCEFFAKDINVNNHNLKLLLWDTAGQEVFRSFTPNFLRGAKIVLIAYDLNNIVTLNNVEVWINQAEKIKNVKIIIFGNKCDLNEKIDSQVLNLLIKKYNNLDISIFKNLSAKNGKNILELFQFVGKKILENEQIPEIFNNTETVSLESEPENKKKSNCC